VCRHLRSRDKRRLISVDRLRLRLGHALDERMPGLPISLVGDLEPAVAAALHGADDNGLVIAIAAAPDATSSMAGHRV
jgi:hypothetical protein